MRVPITLTVRNEEALSAALEQAAHSGPAVIVAKVDESAPTAKPPLDCVAMKHRFMSAMEQHA
jgi:hypothetical protein